MPQDKPPHTSPSSDSTPVLKRLEQKLDALLAYTQQLESENAKLKTQLQGVESERNRLSKQSAANKQQLASLIEQLMVLEDSHND